MNFKTVAVRQMGTPLYKWPFPEAGLEVGGGWGVGLPKSKKIIKKIEYFN